MTQSRELCLNHTVGTHSPTVILTESVTTYGIDHIMKSTVMAMTILFGIASLTMALTDEPPDESGKKPVEAAKAVPVVPHSSTGQARRQAEILHTAVHATLQAVHHGYYREDEGLPIPAAILKDVFKEMEKEQQVKLRWLAVEGRAMNSDHKPRDSFEEDAVRALKSGKREFERTEQGVYRRAGAITLTNQCLKCHVPDRKNTNDRTAGLIIAIEIHDE
jgi:hypothetical protein